MFDIDEVAKDMADFTGRTFDDCVVLIRDRLGEANYHAEWKRSNPRTPAEVERFYRDSEWAMFEQARFHLTDPWRKGNPWYPATIAYEAIEFVRGARDPEMPVLDYGAGIGSLLIHLWDLGLRNLHYYDLESKTKAFARFRASRKGADIRFVPEGGLGPLAGGFPVVMSFECFEHLDDIPSHLSRVRSLLRPGGHFFYTVTFRHNPDEEKDNPSHLSKYLGKDVRWFREQCLAAGFRLTPSLTHVEVPG